MNSKLKNIIIFLIVVGSILCLALFFGLSQRTIFNKEDITGNTAGNLYNGGLFSEYDGRIYFSNMSDDGALYSMDLNCTNVIKIYPDKAKYINVDENYIYYSRVNNTKKKTSDSIFEFYNTGIYRMDKDGDNLKLLYKDPAGLVSLFKNTIFYQHYNSKTGMQFYKVQIDASKETKLSKDPILPASFYNGKMYYSGTIMDHEIHALSMNDFTVRTVYSGNTYMPNATDDGIYFISLDDNYKLCRIDYNGQNKTVLVDDFISTYNISLDGNTIYYQIDGGDNNRLEALDLTTMTTATLRDGDFKEIHVTTNYVFFRDFNETDTYAYDPSTGNLNTFHPPVITK